MIRGVCLLAVLAGFCVVAGCASGPAGVYVEEEEGQAVVSLGTEGAVIARGQVRIIEDTIMGLQGEYRECAERRAALRKDAAQYKEKAAAGWQDPTLNDAEREALSSMYKSLSLKRQNEARRRDQLMTSYTARISALKAKRMRMLRLAGKLDGMKTAAPR